MESSKNENENLTDTLLCVLFKETSTAVKLRIASQLSL
jgi:hypothetical protein